MRAFHSYSMYFPLLLLLSLSCLLPASVVADTIQVPFGSLLIGCGFPNAQAAVALAIDDLNNGKVMGSDYNLGINAQLTLNRQDFCTVPSAPGAPLSYTSAVPYVANTFLTQKPKSHMVVGPVFSSLAVTSVLEVGHITSIAPTNVASVNRAVYPYQATTDCLVSTQGPILAKLAAELGWKQVAILFNSQYQDLTNAFTAAAISMGSQVITSVSFNSLDTVVGHSIDLSTQVTALRESGARIFVYLIFQADILSVFSQMRDAGLTGAPYGCMGNNEWIRYLYSANPGDAILPHIQGCVGTAIGLPVTSPEFKDFSTRWNNKFLANNAAMFGVPTPLVTSLLFYNAVLSVGYTYKAFYQLIQQCNGFVNYDYNDSLDTYTFLSVNTSTWSTSAACAPYASMDTGLMLNTLMNTPAASFPSLLGQVSVGADGSRAPAYLLVNIPAPDGQVVQFGQSTLINGTNVLTYAMSKVLWPGGGTTVPLYAPYVLYDGLILAESLNPSGAILSYMLAVVGSFVASILFEDPLFRAKQKKFTRADYLQTTASALALSIAAIWPTFIVCYSQLTIQAAPIMFEPVKVLVSWVVVWFILTVTLITKLQTFKHQIPSSDRIAQNQANGSVAPLEASAESLKAPKSAFGEADQDIEAGKSSAPQAPVYVQFCRAFGKSMMCIDRFTIIAAFLFVTTLAVMELMGIYSITVPATLSMVAGFLVAGVLSVTVLSVVALQLLFHLDVVQWISCLFTAMPIFLAHQFGLHSLRFTYSNAAADHYNSSASVSINTMMIISIVIAASCCFILIAVQFYRNKITSQGWLRQLDSVIREKKRLTSQLEMSHILNSELSSSLDQSRLCMQLINLSRPSSYQHLSSYAWTMCQKSSASGFSFDSFEQKHSKSGENQRKLRPASESTTKASDESILGGSPPQGNRSASPILSHRPSLSSMAPSQDEFFRSLKWLRDVTSPEALRTDLVDGPELRTVLSHPFGVELLRASLKDELCEESLHFLMAVRIYEAEHNNTVRAELGNDIFRLFIESSAASEVNLSNEMKKQIARQVAIGQFPPTLFVDAAREIFALLSTNTWKTFVTTPAYRLFALVRQNKSKIPSSE